MLVSDHHKSAPALWFKRLLSCLLPPWETGGGQKRKIDDLMKGLNDVKATQQQQQQQLDSLTTRVDRIEKSTSLVVEFASQVEAVYKTAEETRDFKNLAKQAAEALCAELGPKINLPYPLPSQTPE